MALDKNEMKLIAQLVEALSLLGANAELIDAIKYRDKPIDDHFIRKVSKILREHGGHAVCLNAIGSWRDTLPDKEVLSFVDDWIKWKKGISETHIA